MSIHLERDLDELRRGVVALAALVEQAVRDAVAALRTRDAALARRVAEGDARIDLEQNEVEEGCLKVLALHQPVASDLRGVAAVLQMTTDLERVGDLAEEIAGSAAALAALPPVPAPPGLEPLAALAASQLGLALDAFARRDTALARAVCRRDAEVDRLNEEVAAGLVALMEADPGKVRAGLALVAAAGHLERIADHATNIAEDTIYLVEGEIVRHSPALRVAG